MLSVLAEEVALAIEGKGVHGLSLVAFQSDLVLQKPARLKNMKREKRMTYEHLVKGCFVEV
jgi:hypothetical protein